MSDTITVPMAHFAVTRAPNLISTSGLGSCIAICLLDPVLKIGGLAHIMLPQNPDGEQSPPARYADTGLAALLQLMAGKGANTKKLVAKIAGGASIFTPTVDKPVITVGKNNIAAVRALLTQYQIPLHGEHTAGVLGRSVLFFPDSGRLEITLANPPTKQVVII